MSNKSRHSWKWIGGDIYLCLECKKRISEKDLGVAQQKVGSCTPVSVNDVRRKMKVVEGEGEEG